MKQKLVVEFIFESNKILMRLTNLWSQGTEISSGGTSFFRRQTKDSLRGGVTGTSCLQPTVLTVVHIQRHTIRRFNRKNWGWRIKFEVALFSLLSFLLFFSSLFIYMAAAARVGNKRKKTRKIYYGQAEAILLNIGYFANLIADLDSEKNN